MADIDLDAISAEAANADRLLVLDTEENAPGDRPCCC
jgi:hypothetical protein